MVIFIWIYGLIFSKYIFGGLRLSEGFHARGKNNLENDKIINRVKNVSLSLSLKNVSVSL